MNEYDKKIILGIETSCDETACAIVTADKKILANIIYSQIKEHKDFGGVVPEIAARTHLEKLPIVINQAMKKANLKQKDLKQLAGIAAATGPGLIGGVIVGMQMAKAIALSNGIPFIEVNHLEAHALTARLTNNITFPFLVMIASGGNTGMFIAQGVGKYALLGETLDDAVGECFDKTAKILNLGFSGGVEIEKRAKLGNDKIINLPIPMKGKNNMDFSFSGLKTRVKQIIESGVINSSKDVNNLCASFQNSIACSLENRLEKALKVFQEKYPNSKNYQFVLAGGVASNFCIRGKLKTCCENNNFSFFVANKELCTDNAVMIAWAGIENLNVGKIGNLTAKPKPRWPLNQIESCEDKNDRK